MRENPFAVNKRMAVNPRIRALCSFPKMPDNETRSGALYCPNKLVRFSRRPWLFHQARLAVFIPTDSPAVAMFARPTDKRPHGIEHPVADIDFTVCY